MTPALPVPWPGSVRRRLMVLAGVALASCAVSTAPASAGIGIKSFSITPSTTQAGIPSSTSGPDLNIDVKFNSTNWDSPNKATISLAPGLLANPQAASKCSPTQFQFNQCPGSAWIGSGWTTGTAPGIFGFTLPFATNAYLIQPSGDEPARIGLIVNFFGWPVESATAPVQLRTTPGNVGADIDFSGLPNLWNGISIVLDEIQLTLPGSVNHQILTRNPTGCTPAVSTVSAVSYGNPGTTVTGSSAFTPTGCGSLSFNPQFADAVQLDTGDDGLAYGAQVTQSAFDAATRSVTITTPPSLSPRITALSAACTSTDITTCPAIGNASVSTPILPNAVLGKIVLVAHPASLPSAAILFGSPFPAEVDGTAALINNDTQLAITFDTLPDVPLSNLTIVLNGGPTSLFRAGTHICDSAQSAIGAFTAFNGATATQTVATPVLNCPTTTATAAGAFGSRFGSAARLRGARVSAHLADIVRRHARTVRAR